MTDLSSASWRKSSYSTVNGGECIEVAPNVPGSVPVRDSKNPEGPALVFSVASFTTFIKAVKNGAF